MSLAQQMQSDVTDEKILKNISNCIRSLNMSSTCNNENFINNSSNINFSTNDFVNYCNNEQIKELVSKEIEERRFKLQAQDETINHEGISNNYSNTYCPEIMNNSSYYKTENIEKPNGINSNSFPCGTMQPPPCLSNFGCILSGDFNPCNEVRKCAISDPVKENPSIRVNLGIDENLRMILQMDPNLIDLRFDGKDNICDTFSSKNFSDINGSTNSKSSDKVLGLPPKSGGYDRIIVNIV